MISENAEWVDGELISKMRLCCIRMVKHGSVALLANDLCWICTTNLFFTESMKAYLDLLSHILESGEEREDRTSGSRTSNR